MNFNFGMNIFPSSCYTCKEFRTPPISCMGRAHSRVNRVQKPPFYASPWWLTTPDRSLDLWSRRPKLPINQVGSLRFLRPWCGDGLKSGKKKKTRLAQNGPISQILSHLKCIHCPMSDLKFMCSYIFHCTWVTYMCRLNLCALYLGFLLPMRVYL